MAQFAQCLRFNLTDAFACDIEFTSHFLKGARPPVVQTEPQTENLFLPGCEGVKDIDKLFLQQGEGCRFSLYEALVARVFGSTQALPCLKVLNGVWLTLTNYLIYLLGRRFAGERAGRTVALLFFLYAGAWSLSTVLTNQFMGTALLLSGLAICLLPSEKRWFLLPLGGAVLALSNAIRSDAVIAAIAVALTFLLLPGTGGGEVRGSGLIVRLYARARRVMLSSRMTTSFFCSTRRCALSSTISATFT